MLEVLVVDDEQPALEDLAYLLRQHPRIGTVVTASDATFLSGSGIAVSTFDATSAKNFTFDNVTSQAPSQYWTVTRAVNGVAKAQPATVGGASTTVTLWKPAVIAL